MGRYNERRRLLKRPLWDTRRPSVRKHFLDDIEADRKREQDDLAIFDGIRKCTGKECEDLLRGLDLGYMIKKKRGGE